MIFLDIVYCTNEYYIIPTCVSILSVIRNNPKAGNEKHVKFIFHIFCDDINNWKDEYKAPLDKLVMEYGEQHDFNISDSSDIADFCKKYDIPAYKGSYSIYTKMLLCDIIKPIGKNILYLDGDTLVCTQLYDFAVYDFPKDKSCGAYYDTMNSKFWKHALNMGNASFAIFSVLLVNPERWKDNRVSEKIRKQLESWACTGRMDVILFSMVADQGLMSKSMENDWELFPARYMTLPGNALLSDKERTLMFGLRQEEYYRDDELKDAIQNPGIIHYMHYIVPKPWLHDELNPLEDIWVWYYHQLDGVNSVMPLKNYEMSMGERVKRFLFLHFRILYLILGRLYTKFYTGKTRRMLRKYKAV